MSKAARRASIKHCVFAHRRGGKRGVNGPASEARRWVSPRSATNESHISGFRRHSWTRAEKGQQDRELKRSICGRPEQPYERGNQTRIALRRTEPGWRAAVLDERAKRVRKAAANRRQPPRAERAM